MHISKQPRFPYFDFSKPLAAVVADTRTHFADSFDAITLCHFSKAGRQLFHADHKYEQKPQVRYYCLNEQGWRWGRSVEQARAGQSAHFAGDGMLFGRLHAHVVKLDGCIHGPHPVGTIVQVATGDSTVSAGQTQTLSAGLLHIDGSPEQLECGRFQATYDYMDDSDLRTRYLQGFKPDPSHNLFGSLYTTAQRFYENRADRRAQEPAHQEALQQVEAQLWQGEIWSIVARASLTPHIGTTANVPIRRPHGHMVVARPA